PRGPPRRAAAAAVTAAVARPDLNCASGGTEVPRGARLSLLCGAVVFSLLFLFLRSCPVSLPRFRAAACSSMRGLQVLPCHGLFACAFSFGLLRPPEKLCPVKGGTRSLRAFCPYLCGEHLCPWSVRIRSRKTQKDY
ncbi:hypothetical protein Q9966_001787, partial [Columba livia]